MGCNSDWRTFEAPNEKAALALAKRIMDDACYEDGHDAYAGHIGIAQGIKVHRAAPMPANKAHDLLFGTYDPKTGDELTKGLAEKWGPAILIRVRNKGGRKARWLLGAECAS